MTAGVRIVAMSFRGGVHVLAARASRQLGALNGPKWLSLALIAVTLACAIVLGWLVYETSLDKQVQGWGKAFLFAIGALTAVATVAVSWQPGNCSPLQRIVSPFGAGLLLMAVFGAFGTMTSALSLFEPRAATTADTDAIKTDTSAMLNATRAADRKLDDLTAYLRARFPDDPPILRSIVGRWGELQPACAVIWDVSIRRAGAHAALIAEAVRRPDGTPPYRMVGEIVAAKDNVLQVVAEEPDASRGSAATFVLNPATDRLAWDDRSRAAGVEEYRRCP